MVYTYGINNKAFQLSTTGKLLCSGPYNPLNLPPFTIRVRFLPNTTPKKFNKGTATLVDGVNEIYDLTYKDPDWSELLYSQVNLVEVIGANSTGVVNMSRMFESCTHLTDVALFDTSSVTDMNYMFYRCTGGGDEFNGLQSVPLFDTSSVTTMEWMFALCYDLTSVSLFNTSNVTDMNHMFYNCNTIQTIPTFNTSSVVNMEDMCGYCRELTVVPLFNTSKVTNISYAFELCSKVQTGALALYRQASSQANPPTNHKYTFNSCGIDTTTGSAELAQIPTSWRL